MFKSYILNVLFFLLGAGCGVRGQPEPPEKPLFIGTGKPLKSSHAPSSPSQETPQSELKNSSEKKDVNKNNQ